jgi:beta-glucosidase
MRGELQRSAKNICNVLLQSEAFRRLLRGEQIVTQASSAFSQTQSHLIKIEENTEIMLDGMEPIAGTEKELELDIVSGGEYKLVFTVVSNLNPLAQLPLNVLINDQFSTTFVFNGTDGQWTTREKFLNLTTGALKLTLALPQSGLRFQRLRFIKL